MIRKGTSFQFEKRKTDTFIIPPGRIYYVGVFVASEEYPYWTGQNSRFNDEISWSVTGTDVFSLRGNYQVNPLDPAWDSAATSKQEAQGLFPVLSKGGCFYVAPTNSSLTLSIELTAKNVGDGALPSSILVGCFPFHLEQTNYPLSTGATGTTDSGRLQRKLIQMNACAYITGEPAPANLIAYMKGLPSWMPITWNFSLFSERAERLNLDNRTYGPVVLSSDVTYALTLEMRNEIVGGRATLDLSIENGNSFSVPFYIRGKNPLDENATIFTQGQVDQDFQSFAWLIARHESRQSLFIYNQFNTQEGTKETPNKTIGVNAWGWGMCQIDRGQEPGCTTAEVYNWKTNVRSMNEILREKKVTYTRFISYFRNAYGSHANWIEPTGVTTNIYGQQITAKDWALMTLYNGTQGIEPITIGEKSFSSPIQFNPDLGTWTFLPNINNYVERLVKELLRYPQE